MSKQGKTAKIALTLAVLLFIVNIFWGIANAKQPKNSTEAKHKAYPLISRRVLTDNPNDIIINFVPLRKKLEAKFSKLTVQKSFYFEYLPDGTSIKIGDDKELVAASLIKLPLVMNLYHAAELKRVDLDKEVVITESELDGGYGDLYKQGAGVKITLREAAKITLEKSDNTSAHVIFDAINGKLKYDEESLARLDVDQTMQLGQAVISSKSYSSVLKSLYFSAYLNNQDSQEVLGYLTGSVFTNRLTKFLPKDVLVAHKIGVFNTSWSESDCGIVYATKRPYSICVMVGLPDDQASAFIAEVSKDVYDFVSKQ
jgi:beta-lactamase class A